MCRLNVGPGAFGPAGGYTTVMCPLGLAGSGQCSSIARPLSLLSAVKLARPLGEASRVRTACQGLDTLPAPFTDSTSRL